MSQEEAIVNLLWWYRGSPGEAFYSAISRRLLVTCTLLSDDDDICTSIFDFVRTSITHEMSNISEGSSYLGQKQTSYQSFSGVSSVTSALCCRFLPFALHQSCIRRLLFVCQKKQAKFICINLLYSKCNNSYIKISPVNIIT